MIKTDYFNLAYIPKRKDAEKLCDYEMLYVDAIYYENGEVYSNLKILDENIACPSWGYNGNDVRVWETEYLFFEHVNDIIRSICRTKGKLQVL